MEDLYTLNSPLFRGIAEGDLKPMMACIGGYVRTYPKGTYIALEGEILENMGMVISGTVHMLKEDVWGNKTIYAYMGANQLFGESFICGSSALSAATFYVASGCKILWLPFARVMHSCTTACQFHHQLIENMVTMLADKNRQLMDKLEVVSRKTLRDKVMAYLSLQAQYAGKNQFEIPLSRSELAEFLCADRTALARELSKMKDEALIHFDKNGFEIL